MDGFGLGLAWKAAMEMVPSKKGGGWKDARGGQGGGGGPQPVGTTQSGATEMTHGPQGYPGAVEDHPGWNYQTGTCDRHPQGCADSAPGAGTPHPWKGDMSDTAAGREAAEQEKHDPYNENANPWRGGGGWGRAGGGWGR